MNNINENRTDKRTPGGEKNKAELKWFILFLAVIFFLPITILAVVEWFTSADAFAIGITGFMQAVIVHGGLGLVAVIIALVLWKNGCNHCVCGCCFFPCPPSNLGYTLSRAPGSRIFGTAGI